MHFLGCLFALLFAAVFIGLAFIGNIISVILSILGVKPRINRKRNTAYDRWQDVNDTQNSRENRQKDNSQTGHTAGRQTQKIFEKDDSEYVDYEEVR